MLQFKITSCIHSTSFSSGSTSQKVVGISGRSGDFGLRFKNDYIPPISNDGDRYRSAAMQLSYKGNEIGFNVYTGVILLQIKEIPINMSELPSQD